MGVEGHSPQQHTRTISTQNPGIMRSGDYPVNIRVLDKSIQ